MLYSVVALQKCYVYVINRKMTKPMLC